MHRFPCDAGPIALSAGLCSSPLIPAARSDYYAGKTIDFMVGGNPGGGFDIYARARRAPLGRHIPGNPTIVVEEHAGRRQRQGRHAYLAPSRPRTA